MRTALKRLILMRGGFSPSSIPGLQLWLDASDSSTLFQDSAGTTPAAADNDPVGYWGDKSGNGKHATQGTTANKFTRKNNIQNGHPALYMDGNDVLGTTSLSLTSFVALCVFKATSGIILYEQSVEANSTPDMMFLPTASPTIRVRRVTTTQSKNAAVGWALDNVTRVTTFEFQGTMANLLLRSNGASVSLTANQTADLDGTATATNAFFIGGQSGIVATVVGHIMELIIVSPHPGATAIAQLESYLNAKWAVY